MATVTRQTKTIISNNHLLTGSNLPSTDSSHRNTANMPHRERKNIASRLNRAINNLHTTMNPIASIMPSPTMVRTIRRTSNILMIARHHNMAQTTSTKLHLAATTHSNPMVEATIISSNTRHSPATANHQVARTTTRATTKALTSNHTTMPTHSTATQTKASMAPLSPAPRTAV